MKEIPKNNCVREVEKADKIKKKAKIELFESMTGANRVLSHFQLAHCFYLRSTICREQFH